ncbi:hypothetical protein [Streptomyces sp. NRRL B-24572]|uniref:hypothetical protein n=1 Tax=Streptomyces sp. NRRL B-24572 TaxID=1962156 RepID=UPI0035901816
MVTAEPDGKLSRRLWLIQFALIVGLNRRVLRAAYASLRTDAYPPFRRDQGGEESGADLR